MNNVKIIIDNRESSLYDNIIKRDLDKYNDFIQISKEQLELGDIHIIFNDNIFIYERKTINDLLASIKDGRYNEQKNRLLSNSNNINYIIEGDDIISSKNQYNLNLLSSIYLHSIYRDKINIFYVKNIEETATFILILSTKICENVNKFINNPNKSTEYIDIIKIKSKKSSNIDKDTCYLLQLSQIPSISKEIAKNIKEIYPNMRILFKTLEESDNKEKLLMQIPNIGKNKANKIIEYLF